MDLTVTIDLTGDKVPETLRVIDRDVILVREGVAFTRLAGDYYNTKGLGALWSPNSESGI